jgi:16S rRNA (cytosine1402-N4)-methyltransferase
MTRCGKGEGAQAAGGLARHVPVLLFEALEMLAPRDGERFIDATFGAGGYSRAILDKAACNVLAIDCDPEAIAGSARLTADFPDRFRIVPGRFGDIAELAAQHAFAPHGIVLDIGVSSMQLDRPERGFSFRDDGPLDMRMSRSGPSAADAVNQLDETELAQVLRYYGEEKRARTIARAIVAEREAAPLRTTGDLARLVERVIGRRGDDPKHPATRTFQALRIYINDELGELARALAGAEAILPEGGRLVIVTFHSLEDRIVKRFFAERSGRQARPSRHLPEAPAGPQASFSVTRGQPRTPQADEVDANPRARSARLRFGVRTAGAPIALDEDSLGLVRPRARPPEALR